LLELYLANGAEILPKYKLSQLLLRTMNIEHDITAVKRKRALASAAILTSYPLQPSNLRGNSYRIEIWKVKISR
jgi:hypothetical protein